MRFIKTTLITIIQGIVMGIAEVVPGISASTATLLLGIYDDFINLLAEVTDFAHIVIKFLFRRENFLSVKKSFKKIELAYGIKLFIGLVIGVVLFSNMVSYLYDTNKSIILSVFFGIILSSLIIPFKIVKKPNKWDLLFFLIGFGVFFSVLNIHSATSAKDIPMWLIFVGGMISVTGMVLPGVNSSFLLIPLGVYELVLNIVSEFSHLNFATEIIIQAVVFGSGVIFGLISIVKLLKYAFAKHLTKLFSLIGGIMIASLAGIWPFDNLLNNLSDNILSIFLVIISSIITLVFIRLSKPEKEFEKNN